MFIVLSDPPHTKCDSQVEAFKQSQIGFLYPNPKIKSEKTSQYKKLITQCKIANSPGGCYEFFMRMKQFLLQIRKTISDECNSDLANVSPVERAVWESAGLMTQLAWGEKPPETYYQKFGWLDTADISLFCSLKREAIQLFGEETWAAYRESLFTKLPGASELSRKKVWEVLLLSVNCDQYP